MLRRMMVPVTVRRLDREATVWDEDFNVPSSQRVYGLPETVKALVRWDERAVPTTTGTDVIRQGSFAVSTDDPDPGFKPGDKVVAIAGRELDPPAYITGSRPSGRIGGRHRFIRYLFETRRQGVS